MAQSANSKALAAIKRAESSRLAAIKRRFAKEGKTFEVPDEHWSGVMPEKYRAELPGKKEEE